MTGGVALIGFMGAGKSTVGRRVASRLRLPFVDSDAVIERVHGPIATIFAELGEDHFRSLESQVVCAEIEASVAEPSVMALGGGAVTSSDVREALSRLAHVVWLDAPVEVLHERARSGGRPLARDAASFAALHERRRRLYEASATAVVCFGGHDGPEIVCDAVLEALDRC